MDKNGKWEHLGRGNKNIATEKLIMIIYTTITNISSTHITIDRESRQGSTGQQTFGQILIKIEIEK